VFSAWDFADSTGRGSDYSVGTVGWLDCLGRLFIVEVRRGKWSPSELSWQVADQAATWKSEKIYIEKSPGADFLQNDILRDLVRCGYGDCPYPEFFKVDNQKGAKEKRKEMLEAYMVHKTLWFSMALANWDDIKKEFVNAKSNSKRKDDIIDSIAHLARIIPATPPMNKTEMEKSQIVWNILAQKQLCDMYFGVRENTTPPPPPDMPMAGSMFEGQVVCCPHCGFSPCIGS
jgi:phage terminase large subunit-like protein